MAVKVKKPSEELSKAYPLIGMDGHFGVDLNLEDNGRYLFQIGTKFSDGKKRMFHFKVEL